MGWHDDLGNFDLGRLTLVGWLVFLLSIAAGIVAAVVVGTYWDSMFPPRPGNAPRRTGPAGFAFFAVAIELFFAAKWALGSAGVTTVRPKSERRKKRKRRR